jgi:hypothetical protein
MAWMFTTIEHERPGGMTKIGPPFMGRSAIFIENPDPSGAIA